MKCQKRNRTILVVVLHSVHLCIAETYFDDPSLVFSSYTQRRSVRLSAALLWVPVECSKVDKELENDFTDSAAQERVKLTIGAGA